VRKCESGLDAKTALAVFKFDLGDVFDVDFEVIAFVEPGGIPRQAGFPAV
jgi:hypothetical protein